MKFAFSKLKEAQGLSPLGLIAILLLLASVSYGFVYLTEAKHMASPMAYHSNKAFYIAEGGIQYTAKYLRGYSDWSSVPNIGTIQFGGGSFQVSFGDLSSDSVSATITGGFQSAERVISLDFSRSSRYLLSEYAISGERVQIGKNCIIDSFTEGITESDAPRLEPPEGHEYVSRTINSGVTTIAPGTYYYSTLTIKKNSVINISSDGPVTIWLQGKFDMAKNSTVNWGGDAANLLILSAATGSSDVSIKKNSLFKGAIYAPEAGVKIAKNMIIRGAIVGSNVTVNKNCLVTHDSDAGTNCEGYDATGTVTISVTGWGDEVS